jgi:hypothetical protein
MALYATIPAGSVEYSKDAAAVEIEELIVALEEARDQGVTHVVGLSGNYRGASYVRLGTVCLEEDEEDYCY